MACSASRETVVDQEKADWGQLSFRETLQTQVVPMSEANLAIPITALHDLPPAAVFMAVNIWNRRRRAVPSWY